MAQLQMETIAQHDRADSFSKKGRGTILVTRHCPVEMRSRSHWSADQFVFAKKLGGGYASTVHLAICKSTGIQVAIKVYHRCKLSQLNNYQVQREIRIHGALDHSYILELYAAFEDEVGVYLVTEYASKGDVFGELDRRGGSMTEADAVRQVMLPFLSALEYLHLLHIIHRDIKPENLLFTAAGTLKVADFGLSIDITQERPVTRVGTLDYMAPEVVVCPDKCLPSDNKEKTHLHYTHLVDSWAVGVLAYELTVGRAPFDAGHKKGTIEQILHGQPKYPAWLSEPARHFIQWCLTKDAAKRPTIQQLATHPWVTSYAQAVRPKMNPGRAESFHDLKHYLKPSHGAAASALHSAHQVRYGGMCPPVAETSSSEEEEGDPLRGPAMHNASSSSCSSSSKSFVAGAGRSPGPSPFAAAAGAAAVEPLGGTPPKKPPVASAGGFFSLATTAGCAAEKLRAFVHRCQSVNNLEGLRAAVLAMPPEPSNSCFEPGGRFYQGPFRAPAAAVTAAPGGTGPGLQQLHSPGGTAAATGVVAGLAAAAALPESPKKQHLGRLGAALAGPHDSSSSWSYTSTTAQASPVAGAAAGAGSRSDAAAGVAAAPAAAVGGSSFHHSISSSTLAGVDGIRLSGPTEAAATAGAAGSGAAAQQQQQHGGAGHVKMVHSDSCRSLHQTGLDAGAAAHSSSSSLDGSPEQQGSPMAISPMAGPPAAGAAQAGSETQQQQGPAGGAAAWRSGAASGLMYNPFATLTAAASGEGVVPMLAGGGSSAGSSRSVVFMSASGGSSGSGGAGSGEYLGVLSCSSGGMGDCGASPMEAPQPPSPPRLPRNESARSLLVQQGSNGAVAQGEHSLQQQQQQAVGYNGAFSAGSGPDQQQQQLPAAGGAPLGPSVVHLTADCRSGAVAAAAAAPPLGAPGEANRAVVVSALPDQTAGAGDSYSKGFELELSEAAGGAGPNQGELMGAGPYATSNGLTGLQCFGFLKSAQNP